MKFKSKRTVQIQFLVLLCLIFSLTCTAKEIHVAKSGVNAPTGRGSLNAPYLTISYLFNTKLVQPGDIILMHQGVYRETVVVNVNDVTIKPYNNAIVTVSGANWYGDSNWTRDPNRTGVFKMTLNQNQVETEFTQFFVNGQHKQIARFPNNTSPYISYIKGSNREMMNPRDQKTGFAVLLNASKPAGNNQTGQVTFSWHGGTQKLPNVTFSDEAIVRGFIGKLRNNIFSYSGDGGQVTKAGDRLVKFKSYNTQGNIWGTDGAVTQPEGFGYIMDLSVLDYEGEWFYKKKQNTIYYKPVGGTIAGKNFEIQRRKFTLKVHANNVKIQNIDFKVGEVELKNANATTLFNCTFTYLSPFQYRRTYGSFRQGILLNNADNTTFESCYIGRTWGSGIIVLKGSDNSKINNSYIEDIGWMGQFTIAVENNGNNTKITKNTFNKASRFHIRTTESVYAKITDNDFSGAMSLGEDAGSIMFTSTGKAEGLDMKGTEIAWNKIHDQKGIPAYDPQDWSNKKFIVALYLEDTDNYTVHHNLIYGLDDEYTSVRLKSNGEPETTKNNNIIAYLGPRTKNMANKMNYYNNTFWGYNHLISFWHLEGGKVNNMEVKNNLMMNGKTNYLSAGNNSVTETNFFNFTQEIAKPPLNYNIISGRNKSVVNASDHFIDAGNGNFRLKTSSTYNTGGLKISGVTKASDPAIGAWEGSTTWWKDRVINAGSSLSSVLLKDVKGKANVKNINEEQGDVFKSLVIYPNPFNETIHVVLDTQLNQTNEIKIKIINSIGMLVIAESIDARVDKEIVIPTSKLANGIYFIEVVQGESSIVRKLVK